MRLGIACITLTGLILYTLNKSAKIRTNYISKHCDGNCEKCEVEKECDFSYLR